MSPGEAVDRFPALRPLAEMTDPPWQFATSVSGTLMGTRTHLSFVEALWVIDERRAGAQRRPLPSRYGAPVPTMSFSGPLSEAVAALQGPVRTDEPSSRREGGFDGR